MGAPPACTRPGKRHAPHGERGARLLMAIVGAVQLLSFFSSSMSGGSTLR